MTEEQYFEELRDQLDSPDERDCLAAVTLILEIRFFQDPQGVRDLIRSMVSWTELFSTASKGLEVGGAADRQRAEDLLRALLEVPPNERW